MDVSGGEKAKHTSAATSTLGARGEELETRMSEARQEHADSHPAGYCSELSSCISSKIILAGESEGESSCLLLNKGTAPVERVRPVKGKCL